MLVASLIICLVNNSLIAQSVYIDNCQVSIHVVLNCIFNFTLQVHVKRAEIEVCVPTGSFV